MIKAYVIAESKLEIVIIKKLLPDELIEGTQFIAPGKYDARPLATTILGADRIPVALIVNTRADDKDIVAEKFNDINFLMRRSSPGVPYKIIMAVPEIEVVLLQSRNLIERTTKRSFTNLEWEFTFSQPKRLLTRFLDEYPQYIRTIFNNMSVDEMRQLQQHPIIDGITNFLLSASIADSKI